MSITEKVPRRSRASGVASDWVHCAGCGVMLYRKRLARTLGVCPDCGHHRRLAARERVDQLADPGSFVQHAEDVVGADPLGFVDSRPYLERLEEAAQCTGEREAAVVGAATVEGERIVLLAMDFRFLGGSMGTALGEIVTRATELARDRREPLVLVCASGGARMQEGALALLQMVKTSQAMALLHEAGLLSICVLTDPTFGGVTASYASLASITLVESGALVGFAGPRVIAQTIGAALPTGFQSAESLLRHGLVDRVEPRAALRPLLARILRLHRRGPREHLLDRPRLAMSPGPREPSGPGSAVDAWDTVRTARHIDRPTALDYLADAFDDFVELHGDRGFADDPALVGGVARLGGHPVVVLAHQKGHDTRELVARNFGMPHPEGYRKARRLVEHAERLGLPLVTLVDSPGAYPGVQAEERGQAIAIAELIARCVRTPVPIVSVITGEGGSGGALALATCDRLLMLENSFYSVISPEGCAAILWRSPAAAADAARRLRITAWDLHRLGIADAVVPEPPGGAHTDRRAAAGRLRTSLLTALDEVTGLPSATLLAAREDRYRSVGLALAPSLEEHGSAATARQVPA